MNQSHYLILETRGLIEAVGWDTRRFLQGMVSNDVDKLSPERALWAAFLTPQGKFLHEFFLSLAPGADPQQAAVRIDCEAARLADLQRRLGRYKLRAEVALEDASERYAVAAVFGAGALEAVGLPAEAGLAKVFADGLVHVDPRLAELGARAVLPRESAEAALQGAGFAPASRRPGPPTTTRCASGSVCPTAAVTSRSSARRSWRTASMSWAVSMGIRAASWARS